MLEVAVIGESEFTMGFRFAGIRQIINVEKNGQEAMESLFSNKSIGIIITSSTLMATLSSDMRQKLHTSVTPVTVVVSDKDEMGNLREAIKKAIGVDLWK